MLDCYDNVAKWQVCNKNVWFEGAKSQEGKPLISIQVPAS
jgi:hypothetical protein